MREAKNLILMLTTSVIVGLIVVIASLAYWGPQSTYQISQVLISPAAMEEMKSAHFNPKTEKGSPFDFHRIEFANAGSLMPKSVSAEEYAAFYNEIKNLRSLSSVTKINRDSFNKSPLATLSLFVKRKGNTHSEMQFQEVEFLKGGDLFRVLLRQDQKEQKWIYFTKKGICEEAATHFAGCL